MDLGHHRPRRLSAAEGARTRAAKKRLENVSLVLVAAGLLNVIRVLVAGKLPGRATGSS